MSKTMRTVRLRDDDGSVQVKQVREVDRRKILERADKLRRIRRDDERIARDEDYSARREGETVYPLGGIVRAVA